MSEPIYSVTTERLYRRLPETYRVLDAQNDWQFKKFISSIADQLADIETIVARIEYLATPENRADFYSSLNQYNTYTRPAGSEDPAIGFAPIEETSDLVDARTADPLWLNWLGQLVGADVVGIPSPVDKRYAILDEYLGIKAGSREALEAAVLQYLTGTKYSRVYPHRNGASGSIISIGTEWDVLIVTKAEETESGADLIAEIIRKGAKPAGVELHHVAYTFTWEVIETSFTSWAQIDATGSWANFEVAGAENLPV